MKPAVLHPVSKSQIDLFVSAPSHAIILYGPKGVGKSRIASRLAEQILNIGQNNLADYPYAKFVNGDNGKAIGIEEIRMLSQFLSLKVPSKLSINRVAIISGAELLTLEAQNALLKNLEEPPEGTLIILTANNLQRILPTLRSRTQIINIKKPDKQTLSEHFSDQGISDLQFDKLYSLSSGLPEIMESLLGEDEHPLSLAAAEARRLLGLNKFEKLLSVDELSKNPGLTSDILAIFQQMAHISLLKSGSSDSAKWQNILEASFDASAALAKNAQPKLVLAKLMLSI